MERFEAKSAAAGVVVLDEDTWFSLDDLSHACQVERTHVLVLVQEGVLQPEGDTPENWRFTGPALRRARTALRLAHDFELDTSGTALVLDLLQQIEELRSRLRRAGLG